MVVSYRYNFKKTCLVPGSHLQTNAHQGNLQAAAYCHLLRLCIVVLMAFLVSFSSSKQQLTRTSYHQKVPFGWESHVNGLLGFQAGP